MDYILADRYEIAPGPSDFTASGCYGCHMAMSAMNRRIIHPRCLPCPRFKTGYVTFGSFNNPAKIGPGVVEVWSRILRRMPDARVVLKYQGMNDPAVAGRLAAMFAGHGIDPGRAAFLGKSFHPDLLATITASTSPWTRSRTTVA